MRRYKWRTHHVMPSENRQWYLNRDLGRIHMLEDDRDYWQNKYMELDRSDRTSAIIFGTVAIAIILLTVAVIAAILADAFGWR